MSRLLSLFILILTVLTFTGCGGGSNSSPPGAVSISGSAGVALVDAEMIKDVSPNLIPVTVNVSGNLDNVAVTAGTVRLERYTIDYTRRDGGVGLASTEGTIGQTISIVSGNPSSVTFDVIAMHSGDKLYSDFARDFLTKLDPVEFDCKVTIFGRTTSGDAKQTSFGFVLQAGVFDPTAEFIPIVSYFNQTTGIIYPGDYAANWLVDGTVDDAVFFMPWNQYFVLPTSANYFPLGGISVSTSVLNLPPNTVLTAGSGVLNVSNRFGSSMSSDTDAITITSLPEILPDPPATVDIINFYASKTIVNLGDEVTLFWTAVGQVDELSILPTSFDGVPVVFSGPDLSFGSVTIKPTETVLPILRASNSVSQDVQFLAEEITVIEPFDPTAPPTIDFFRTDRTAVNLGRSVVFYWNVSGAIDRVELFPFNGNIFDVTDLNSLVSPPFIELGEVDFSLVVFGKDGSIVQSQLSVTVNQAANLPVAISGVILQPSGSINNGDEAAFSFRVSDPDRHDSSWKVSKIAGDGASFFPRDGEIPGGNGPAVVAVRDFVDNENGYLTFLIEAWDDDILGFSGSATKDISLLSFTTTGMLSDDAPQITAFTFDPTGPETAPGTEGSLSFAFEDPDNLDLRWTLFQVSGDVNGSLSQTTGTTGTGSGQVQVSYNDDPDTPTDPVVFLLRVEEYNTQNPQSTILTLRVDKGDGAVEGGTTTNTGEPIGFPLSALYGNFTGDPNSAMLLSDRTIYFNGNLADPHFYQSSDLSGEVVGLSFVVDLAHETNEPGAITDVLFERSFITPSSAPANEGNFVFVNYFQNAGDRTGGTSTPTTGYIARYRMTFTVEDFRSTSAPMLLNLPESGSMTYSLTIKGVDTSANIVNLSTDVKVTVPAP